MGLAQGHVIDRYTLAIQEDGNPLVATFTKVLFSFINHSLCPILLGEKLSKMGVTL